MSGRQQNSWWCAVSYALMLWTYGGAEVLASSDTMAWLEAGFSQGSVEMHAQSIYRMQFFQSIAVADLKLHPPAFGLAEVREIGDATVGESTRSGIRYRVTTRRFLVFPFASGTLRPVGGFAEGKVAVAGQQQLISRRYEAPNVELLVKPLPANLPHGAWLPAKAVQLRESWDSDISDMRAGEAVMRTIRIEATGVDAGSIQAPDFVLGQAIAIKQASRRYNRLAGDWNVGVLEVTWSLLPRRAGVLQVLPYRIDWWDVVNGVSKSAALEGRTIVVGNPSGSAVNGRWPLAEANTLAASLESKEARWRVPLVLAVITATVAFLSGWMWRSSLPWRRLRIACLGGSAANAEKALLAFLAVRNRFPRTLGEVCRTVNDDFLLRPVRELERARYGHAGTSWDGRNLVARSWKLRRAFVRGLAHGSTGIRAGE